MVNNMKNGYQKGTILTLFKGESGLFMPVALLFFSVIFVICFYSIDNMGQEVNYHHFQMEWLKKSYLGDIGTRAAISMLDTGDISETKGEWIYYNGTITYDLKPIGKGNYQISLVIQTDHRVSRETIIYSSTAKKVLKRSDS